MQALSSDTYFLHPVSLREYFIVFFLFLGGKQVGVAVVPQRCAPLSPGSIPGPGAVRPFGFQSILASAGFFWVLRFSSCI